MWKSRFFICVRIKKMIKKLSQKEKNEIVTNGYFHDYLNKRFDKQTKEIYKKMDNQKKEIYKKMDNQKKEIYKKMDEQSKEFRKHLEFLIEHQTNQLQSIFEGFDNRYVLRTEWRNS